MKIARILVPLLLVLSGCGEPVPQGFVNSKGEIVQAPDRTAIRGEACAGRLRNQTACSPDLRQTSGCTCDSTMETMCPGEGVWQGGGPCAENEICGTVERPDGTRETGCMAK